MVQDPLNNPPSVNRGWGWNREPWGAGCGWFALFWIIILIIFAGWGWWGGGSWGARGWNNNAQVEVPQGRTPVNVTNNYYFGPGSDEFLGKTVTVTGKVDRIYNNQTFTLAPGAGGGHDLLIVTSPKATPSTPLKQGETVEVTGSVKKFSATDFEKESKAHLERQQFAEFRERPAIFATVVKPEEHPVSTKQ